MSSNPKIFVFKMREIIYTLLLILFLILLILCLVLMFSGHSRTGDSSRKKAALQSTEQTAASENEPQQTQTSDAGQESSSAYTPGIYTTPVSLGDSSAMVEVTVDSSHINSIRLVNLSETTAASFPLVSPSLDHIASQILERQSLEGITCPQENRYTSQLLLSAVAEALELAAAS